MVTPIWPEPAWRAALLIGTTVAAWALEILPDCFVGLGLLIAWNLAGVGPTSVSLSGFASPTWFLLIGVLTLGTTLGRSGLLQRLALRLLRVFPATFPGQVIGLLLGGLLMTPLLPLNIGRCALTAPLVRNLAELLGYPPRSRPAVGLGLAAFVGAGQLGLGFLSGATVNLIAWSLLPADARPGWGLWMVAAAPTLLLLLVGSGIIITMGFRPGDDRPLPPEAIQRRLQALGPLSRRGILAGGVTLAVLVSFLVGSPRGLGAEWIACAGALVLLGAGTITRENFLAGIDWPLLIFLGTLLGLPAMIQYAGLDHQIIEALPFILRWGHGSPAWAILIVFLVTVAARFVLSIWVGVPLLTIALVPGPPGFGLHPWVVAFVVLAGAAVWVLPYQSSSYLAFWGSSEGRLFSHRQVRAFGVAYLAMTLFALLVSIPLWRALGLVR